MIIGIDGHQIGSEADFHDATAGTFGLPRSYGRNLDALWDVLSTDVKRPVCLIWSHSGISEVDMTGWVDMVVKLLRRVEEQDVRWGFPVEERFNFFLR